ncbi:hypothetical protein LM900335_90275 [Listeria monocytogenes]|nr:hypothetical protein LM900335_90275 [Listeria monocytogenes]
MSLQAFAACHLSDISMPAWIEN